MVTGATVAVTAVARTPATGTATRAVVHVRPAGLLLARAGRTEGSEDPGVLFTLVTSARGGVGWMGREGDERIRAS